MRLEGLLKIGRRFVIILGGRYVIVSVMDGLGTRDKCGKPVRFLGDGHRSADYVVCIMLLRNIGTKLPA